MEKQMDTQEYTEIVLDVFNKPGYEFIKKTGALTSNELGGKAFNDFVKDKYVDGQKYRIIIPEEVRYIAVSFIQGFIQIPCTENETDNAKKNIVFESKNKDISNKANFAVSL